MKTRRTASKKPGLDEAAGLSDQELVPFFELALDLLCIAGTDGYFKRVNPAFERTLGYSEAELLGRPFLEFVHEDDQICTMREMEKLGSGQNTVFFSNRYRHRNGGYRWIEWNAAPDPKGARIYAAARDITERRRSEERFRQVVSAAPNGILMMTRRGEVVLSNPRAEVITGLPSGELKGRHLADFLPRLERKHVMQTMQSCLHLESDDPRPNSE